MRLFRYIFFINKLQKIRAKDPPWLRSPVQPLHTERWYPGLSAPDEGSAARSAPGDEPAPQRHGQIIVRTRVEETHFTQNKYNGGRILQPKAADACRLSVQLAATVAQLFCLALSNVCKCVLIIRSGAPWLLLELSTSHTYKYSGPWRSPEILQGYTALWFGWTNTHHIIKDSDILISSYNNARR